MKSCRHKDFWLLAGIKHAWCPDCGAIRRIHECGLAEVQPKWKRWIKPEGQEKCLKNLKRMEDYK